MLHETQETGDEEAREATESIQDAAVRVGDEVKQEAGEQAENIRSQVASAAEEQRDEAANTVAAVAAALHAGVDSLESDDQSSMAGYWRSAATSIDQLADRVKNKPAGDVLSEAEDYAREQPGLGFGGAMVAGFMLARFLKSSSQHSRQSTNQSPRQNPRPGTHATALSYPAPRTNGGDASASNPTL